MISSIASAAFTELVSKRQALVATEKEIDRLLDLCQCNRGCHCEMKAHIGAAKAKASDAYHDLRACEAAWAEFKAAK